MSDALVQFLRARLDEDEQVARAAASLSVTVRGSDQWRVSGSHADDGGTYWSITTASPDLDRITPVEMVGSGMSGGGAHTEEVAAHIARHDPARVLRDIEAQRRIIADFENYDREAPELDVPESVLRLLALRYSDHADYDEAWRP